MQTFFKANIVGVVTQDVKVFSKEGQKNSVVVFPVVTDYSEKKGDQWEKVSQYHNIVTFGKLADIAEKYIIKGTPVFIEATIKYREKEINGIKKRLTDFVASRIILLGNKKSDTSQENKKEEEIKIEDIPF